MSINKYAKYKHLVFIVSSKGIIYTFFIKRTGSKYQVLTVQLNAYTLQLHQTGPYHSSHIQYNYTRLVRTIHCIYSTITLDWSVPFIAYTLQLHQTGPYHSLHIRYYCTRPIRAIKCMYGKITLDLFVPFVAYTVLLHQTNPFH